MIHASPGPRSRWMAAALLVALGLLAGCATPDKPVRPTLYDFGPGMTPAAAAGAAPLSALVLGDVEPGGSFEGSALLYRLGYADAHQLRPYALARWTAPPAQLVRQRLREHLGRERPVLDLADAASISRRGGAMPRVLRVELEEFTHYFETESASQGLLRLRCTLLENTAAGERLLAQRTVVLRRPAPTPDAAGGVRALAAATDAAAEEIAGWLRTVN